MIISVVPYATVFLYYQGINVMFKYESSMQF